MLKLSPAMVIALIALFIALTANGVAAMHGASKSQPVLGPTVTVTKSLYKDRPSGVVTCPRGHQAVSGGWDSWVPPGWQVLTSSPMLRESPVPIRDYVDGVHGPATGWMVVAEHKSGNAALNIIVVCAKVVRVTS